MLRDDGLIAAWGAARISEERQKLASIRQHLAGRIDEGDGGTRGGITCSRRWFDDVWQEATPYPPPGMVLCLGCGSVMPRDYIGSSGHCMDCRTEALPDDVAERLPKSHSVIEFKPRGASRGVNG